jgi:hypothetical protein
MTLKSLLNEWLKDNSQLLGSMIIKLLLQFENSELSCIQIIHYIDPPDLDYFEKLLPEAMSNPNPMNLGQNRILSKHTSASDLAQDIFTSVGIPKTDTRCLAEVNKRINQLKKIITACGNSKDTTDADQQFSKEKSELTALCAYRNECLCPGGRITNFPTEQRRAYQAVYKAIKRMRDMMPDHLSSYLRKHLKMGVYCVWMD